MELTPELYKALKESLFDNEKIIFGYPIANKTMAGFDNLDEIPFDPDADTVDVIIKQYDSNNKPTAVILAGTFTIVPSKFHLIQESSDGNKKRIMNRNHSI